MHLTQAQLDAHTAEFERGEAIHQGQQDALELERREMERSKCGIYKAPPAHVLRITEFDYAIQTRAFDHRFEFTYLGNWKKGVQRDKTMYDVFINAMDNDEIAAKLIRAVIHCAANGNVEAIEACNVVRSHFVKAETHVDT